VFPRYTDAAKRAIFFAHTEAMHRNEHLIRPADILIGLTWEADSGQSPASLKELAVKLRGLVGIPHLPSTSLPYQREGAIPLDADAKKVIASAAAEADRDGQYWIDSDHVLRGLLTVPNDAADALLTVGLDLESVRSASTTFRRNFPAAPAPVWGRVRLWVDRYKYLMLLVVFVVVLVLVLNSGGRSSEGDLSLVTAPAALRLAESPSRSRKCASSYPHCGR
jgi:Clp amino terminal domain, pathogenicity island component